MTNWDKLLEEGNIGDDRVLLNFGADLKRLYIQSFLTSATGTSKSSIFDSLLKQSVEAASRQSAEGLRDLYHENILPRKDDSPEIATSFVNSLFSRFKDALCAELSENSDLSTNARSIMIVIAPTVITLLGLPLAYAALAIPISILVTRVGSRTLCLDYEDKKKSKEFLNARLALHQKNLLLLEEAQAHSVSYPLRQFIESSISNEEEKIRDLQKQLEQ